MIGKRWTMRGIAVAGLLFAPLLMGAVNPVVSFEERLLAAHNRERAAIGLDPLRWNPALVQSAQRWADRLAATGRFEHAPDDARNRQGENLWLGTRDFFSPEAMVDSWTREKRHFRSGTFPYNSATGRVEDVGHYTQIVWRETKQVGCARATSARNDILVCRYAEPGNMIGQAPF